MWKMYTDVKQGVKIKLDSNFLKKYNYNNNDFQKMFLNNTIIGDMSKASFNLPLEFLVENRLATYQLLVDNLLTEVSYTNDMKYLEPKIFYEEGNKIGLNLKYIGRYKNLHWSFQNELRFLVTLMPYNMFDAPEKTIKEMHDIILNIRHERDVYTLPDSIYLDIKDEALKEIEIVRSPTMDEGSKTLLELLTLKYCPTAKVRDSNLINLI